MTYQECLQLLFSKCQRKIPKNLKEIKDALQKLGNPHETFQTIHVTGTNGKGSVTTKIAKTLELSGYKVGLFTSPHIERFEERIQINSIEITPDEIKNRLPSLIKEFPNFCFFDYATLLAFQYFSENKVDIAVIEVGIGGLYDTTNVIHPLLAIITSVALDHVKLLGSTLDEIAYQKAGIIKPQIPIVVGPYARFDPIFKRAKEMKSPLIEVLPQSGDYDHENQSIALAALQELKTSFTISDEALKKGLAVKPACRFERYGRFVLDVAHNPAGFENLLKTWNQHHPEKSMNAIVGFSSDKDIKTCLKILSSQAKHLFIVQADSKRAASVAKLKEILLQENITHFTACQTIPDAVQKALACDHDVLVCGSFYIMKHAREEIFRLQVG